MNIVKQWKVFYNFNRHLVAVHFIVKRKQHVRVRFAPSPTGYLHLGGLRTALYNHLFAFSNGGKTILRIEDTDQERKVEGAVSQLVEDLAWCGLHYDEGPILQSSRLSLYSSQVKRLIDLGHAYQCFCTSSRLDILRREAIRVGEVPKYDNRCRCLSKEEVSDKLAKGLPHCVRFKLTHCSEPFEDLVYGQVHQDVASLEGDPVILKTDGFPTYHLANVVDDHDMGITHVLRGVEWQSSTQKHLLMYRAFGWEPPKFAHLPLLLNADGSKLSKRQGDVHVGSYRAKGVFPLALINFVVRAGGGFDIAHADRDTTSFTFEQLGEKFDLTKMNGSSCKVLFSKLDTSNQLELQRLLRDEITTENLIKLVQNLVTENFANSEHVDNIDVSKSHVEKILKWTQNRIHYPQDLISSKWNFLWVLPRPRQLLNWELVVLEQCRCRLEDCSLEKEELMRILRECANNAGIKFPAFMKLLRSTLSGLKEGPSVIEIIQILGKETVLQRLTRHTTATS